MFRVDLYPMSEPFLYLYRKFLCQSEMIIHDIDINPLFTMMHDVTSILSSCSSYIFVWQCLI